MTDLLASLRENYHGLLSLYAGLGIIAANLLVNVFYSMVPTLRTARQMNVAAYREKMERPHYAANHQWNIKWSLFYLVAIFALILPFCLTAAPQPWWRMPRDIVVILMFYDFFYYLTHRFLFHDGGVLGGPLMWMHAVHHRQHNPCRKDSSYIHPLEVAIGLGLYVASIFVLSRFMGPFHVLTIVITWFAFTEINLHNHDLWPERDNADRFPFRTMATMARMHHNHHARFTGGNYATISLLYDWMFGTLDYGEAPRVAARPKAESRPAR